MQLSVMGKQLDVGDALLARVNESFSRSLGKYSGDAGLISSLIRTAAGT